jgi:regulator of protease activity HflC (stomatin/prohibitin superfamily)
LKSIVRIVTIALICAAMVACMKVPVGSVGIMVDLYGSDKGVLPKELGPGRYYVGYNQELFTFPTYTQTYTWTRSLTEGRAQDESFTFNSVEGISVNADVGITLHVDPTKTAELFQKYRRGMDEILDTFVHNLVRDALNERSSTMPIEDIYGKGKAQLIADAQKTVQDQLNPVGIVVEKLYLVSAPRLPDAIITAINNKMKATQMAEQRNNEIAQAEAEKTIKIKEAEGEAQSIKIKGDALRDNPGLVQLEAVRKWDGHLPNVSGGAVPFIQVTPTGK